MAGMVDLVRTYAGKETVVMTDTTGKCEARRKQLLASQRKGLPRGRVTYTIRPSESSTKYRKKHKHRSH